MGDIYEYAGEKKTEVIFAFELNYISWPYNCIPIFVSRLPRWIHLNVVLEDEVLNVMVMANVTYCSGIRIITTIHEQRE